MKVFFGVVLILAGPCAACLVGMCDDMLLLHAFVVYTVHGEQVFQLPWLCDVQRRSKLNRWKSTLEPRPKRVSQN